MIRRILMLSLCALIFTAGTAMAEFAGPEVELEAKTIKLARETVRGDYGLVSVDEVKAMLDEGKQVVIVDTMPYEDSYLKKHLPGAVQFLFPIPDMTEWDSAETADKSMDDYAALLGPDKDIVVIVYCGFVKCTRSHNGAYWARQMGYNNVYRMPGGIVAWDEAGYPIESGE